MQSATRSQWQARATRRLGINSTTLLRNVHITEAYAELYLRRPQVYRWAGLAALTSAAVGRGMWLMRGVSRMGIGPAIGLFPSETRTMCELLVAGNGAVFEDIYWQHLAYEVAGVVALEQAYDEGGITAEVLAAWRQIDEGRRTERPGLVWEGNTQLLDYEQRVVLQPVVYDGRLGLWAELGGWVPSPLPGDLSTFDRWGNPANFAERWNWIEHYLMPQWQTLTANPSGVVDRTLMRYIRTATWVTARGIPQLMLAR